MNVLPQEEVHLFPVDEVLSAEMAFSSPEARASRVTALNALTEGKKGIFVVPIAALRKFLPAKATWQDYHLNWTIGTEIELDRSTSYQENITRNIFIQDIY